MCKILMLHRVVPQTRHYDYYFGRGTAISRDHFVQLLDDIESRRWQTINLDAIPTTSSQQTVCLTFDDGYADNVWAFEQLLARDMTATLFPVRDFCQQNFSPIDDMAAWLNDSEQVDKTTHLSLLNGRLKRMLRRLDNKRYRHLRQHLFSINSDHHNAANFLTEKQLRHYHQRGITMGVHGTSHRVWSGLSFSQLKLEIDGAMSWLKALGVTQVQGLCLPHGSYSPLLHHWQNHPMLGVDKAYDNQSVIRRCWFKQGDPLDNIV